MLKFVLGALVAVLLGSLSGEPRPTPAPRADALPARMLWSWDRSEDLSFLPADTGVAQVVESVELRGEHVRVRPWRARLTMPADAAFLPVVHVDALSAWAPALNEAQARFLVEAVVRAARHSGSRAVQVDFEALPSQRTFYLRVLREVRRALPQTYLSVTALASWCLADRWLDAAPVDEVVAMAFRLGRDEAHYRGLIARSATWLAPECTSTGVAADEPVLALPAHRRLYAFSPVPWSAERWATVRAGYTGDTLRP